MGEFWGGLSVLCRCLMAVLLAAWLCGSSLAAQSPDTGSVEGKLTDFYSKPLDGATVVLRNVRTGVEFQVTTGKNGAYRLGGLTQGSYELEARTDSGLGHASGITVMAGRASRVHTAVALGGQSALAARAEQTKWFGAAPGPGREADSATSTIARNPQPVPRPAPTGPPPVRAIAVIPPTPACTSISAGVSPGTIALAHATTELSGGGPHELALPVLRVAAIPINRTGLLLSAAAAASLRAALAEPVKVPRRIEAEAARPEPAEAAISITLSAEEIQALPLMGSAFEADSLGSPPETNPAGEEQESHRGLRSQAAGPSERAGTWMAFGSQGTMRRENSALLVPSASEATVRSIRLVEGAGDALSGIGAAETRSGSDQASGRLHGHAFFFGRQGLLDARNPFTQWVKETAPATATTVPVFTPFAFSPEDHRTRWGVGMGGPLRRDKLFWFAEFDRDQRDHPAVATVKHPENFFAQPSNDELQVLSARLAPQQRRSDRSRPDRLFQHAGDAGRTSGPGAAHIH